MFVDKFILETIKNPASAPFLLLTLFLLLIFIFSDLTIEISKELITNLKNITKKEMQRSLSLLIISIILFSFSIFFIFYKMTEVPAAGFVDDDALIVITANLLKDSGHDSYENKIPYYPYLLLKYHHEQVGGGAPIGIPVYLQTFLQYFIPAGHFSLRLECTLLMVFTSIVLIYTTFLLTKELTPSIFCGVLFNLLPWTRILARVTPQTTAYCFASACFLFALLYLIKDKRFPRIVLYFVSLAILFLSYTPGLLLASMCAILIPLVIAKHSSDHKGLSKKIIIAGIIILGMLYFEFRDEQSFKWNLARAQNSQGLEGIIDLNMNQIVHTFISKATLYIANFLGYLLPQFLFFAGDSNPRHNTGFGGQFFAALCIAFYVGFIHLIERKKADLNIKVLLSFLLMSIIPAAICLEGGFETFTKLPLHALRASCILPPITIIIILGLLRIFKGNRKLFYLYLIVIIININLFYTDYFNNYPKKLGNSWIGEPSLSTASKKALKIIKKEPSRKLFYSCALSTIAYYNIDKIGINPIINGNGLLSNVYHYYNRGNTEPQKGDLFVVQEPFDYTPLNGHYKFIYRGRNKDLADQGYGSSLFEITE